MKQNRTAARETLTGRLVMGAAVCIMMTLILTAVSAAVISAGMLPETTTEYVAMIILLSGSLAGAIAGAGKKTEKRLYVCLTIAALFFVILLAMTAAFFGGQYRGIGVSVLMLLVGAFAGAMVGQGKGRSGNLRRSKIRRR